MGTHAVKIKEPDSKRFEFLAPGGHTTHLRVHAGTASKEVCERIVEQIRSNEPDIIAKIIEF